MITKIRPKNDIQPVDVCYLGKKLMPTVFFLMKIE